MRDRDAESVSRRYNTEQYRKHKRPGHWGSPCPEAIDTPHAQQLLDTGVLFEGAIYNVEGEFAFRAFEHEPENWHGHPIPWTRLPNAARLALMEMGRLDEATWRKAIRKGWGNEFRG
jgi:hypothetical protein